MSALEPPARRNTLSLAAIVAASFALPTIIAAKHGESLRGTTSAYLLTLADRLGFIHSPPVGAIDEWRAPPLFFVNDTTVLQTALTFGALLGAVAMALAVQASFKRESRQHAGMGLIAGWLALMAAQGTTSVASLLAGFALVIAARRERNHVNGRTALTTLAGCSAALAGGICLSFIVVQLFNQDLLRTGVWNWAFTQLAFDPFSDNSAVQAATWCALPLVWMSIAALFFAAPRVPLPAAKVIAGLALASALASSALFGWGSAFLFSAPALLGWGHARDNAPP